MNSSTVFGLPSREPTGQTTDNYTGKDSAASGKWKQLRTLDISADELWHRELGQGFVRLVVFRQRGVWYARAEGRQIIVTEKELRSLSAAQREAERLGRSMLARALEDLT
jgi:hypothetical protein